MDKSALNNILSNPQIDSRPRADLGLVITIPSHNEEALEQTLDSLQDCVLPPCGIEVIVVINASENAETSILELHQATFQKVQNRFPANGPLSFHFLMFNDLPAKVAGVGVARKIAMNEASFRLNAVGNSLGIIACFDADSTCTPNYFVELCRHFQDNPKSDSISIRYEHPVVGELSSLHYEAIIQYELHLRYYVDVQKWLGLPYAFQTVGSSMAVRAYAYDLIGGMNRKKAGEDFYFLQKFIQRGKHTELNTVQIIPSPRISDRVPFGTGRAVGDLLNESSTEYQTYALQSFIDLKVFLEVAPKFFKQDEAFIQKYISLMPGSVQSFLESINGLQSIHNLSQSTKTIEAYTKRFYNWFDAFLLMKFVHHTRDTYYENSPIESVAKSFLRNCTSLTFDDNISVLETLQLFRDIDAKGYMPNAFKAKVNQ